MVACGTLLAWYGINSYLDGDFDESGRIRGYGKKEFGNANDLSMGMLIVLPFAYQLLRWEKGFLKRAVYFAALASMIVVILVSMSRMGMVGLIFLGAVWLYANGKANLGKAFVGISSDFIFFGYL